MLDQRPSLEDCDVRHISFDVHAHEVAAEPPTSSSRTNRLFVGPCSLRCRWLLDSATALGLR